jgi:zinc-ribbon domain
MKRIVVCTKCGKDVDVGNRFCERCGTPLHVILESPTIQNVEFIEVFNSVFNLLANKTNLDRTKYFLKTSEDLLFAKNRREYEDAYKNYSFQRATFGLDPLDFDLRTLFTVFNTTTLAGYSTRVTEELKTGNRSNRMPAEEADSMLVRFLQEGKAELGEEFGYSERDFATPSSRWETFCVALRWKDRFLHYALLDRDELVAFMTSIIGQSTTQTLAVMRETFVQIYDSKKMEQLATRERAETDATKDFLFGYCLKLSESIYIAGTGAL